MSSTGATGATPTAGTPSATLQGLGSLADNFNTFLTLLTTQLKNQDPTAPLDSNQFTQQLVQMTGVEQQLNTNSLLGQLVGNTSNSVATAVNLIGKTVKGASDTTVLTGGAAQWTYNLASAASDLKVQVLDANNKIVYAAAPSSLTAGDHTFSWNGKDLAGDQLPDGGTYTLKVTATDSKGTAITSTNYVSGVVTGVVQENGATAVVVNGGPVLVSGLVSVNPPAVSSGTPAT